MRLWTLHPSLLDAKGLVAVWREALLAQKVLQGQTKGYKYHPQLDRFKTSSDPLGFIAFYLFHVYEEARSRDYRFDETKIGKITQGKIVVKSRQIDYEYALLQRKIKRSPNWILQEPTIHPLFHVIAGPVESWERGEQP